MTIRFVILGLLSQKPQSGYDLKKAIIQSPHFHWSGNNNQVYSTLLQLTTEGMVSSSPDQGSPYPGKKIYHLTDLGKQELNHWLESKPAIYEMNNHLLVHLMFCDSLPAGLLQTKLDEYEREINEMVIIQQEQARRDAVQLDRTPRQRLLIYLAADNLSSHLEAELTWIMQARHTLGLEEE